MCRMLVAIGNTNAEQLLDGLIRMAADENAAHEHNGMGKSRGWKHEDGWGIASLHDGTWKLTKSIHPVFDDPLVADARRIKSKVIVLHARKRTKGEKSVREVHPFRSGEVIFAHNGTVGGDIRYSPAFQMKGTTDSEKLFYSILTESIESRPPPIIDQWHARPSDSGQLSQNIPNEYEEYLKRSKAEFHCIPFSRQLSSSVPPVIHWWKTEYFAGEPPLLWDKNEQCTINTGSNIILSTPEKTFVLVYFRKHPRYYRMALGTGKGLVVVSSEALPMVKGVRWRRLNHGDSIVVDHATGKWEMRRAASHTV